MKVGVIGVGHLGRHHTRIYREMTNAARVKLVGVHDSNADRGKSVASEFETRYFAQVEALAEAVDAVSICVPTSKHFGLGEELLGAGVHVLMEKPLAGTVEEAQKLLAVASRSDLVLAVGHVERFNPAFKALLPYLSKPQFVESHRLASIGPRGLDVSVVLDLMVHDLDLILLATGDRVKDVDASGAGLVSSSPDIVNARIRFAGGCVANLTASRISVEKMRKIRFFQKGAYASLDLLERRVNALKLRGDVDGTLLKIKNDPNELKNLSMGDLIERVRLPISDEEPLAAEIAGFIDRIEGRPSILASGEDGVLVLETAEKILTAMKGSGTEAAWAG